MKKAFIRYNLKLFINIKIIINILLIIFFIYFNLFHNKNKDKFDYSNNRTKLDINFNYEDYENNIITEKIRKYSGLLMSDSEANFINGIIRKHKLKACLEIGVEKGGSSILILNALKDIENSFLVSIDLFSYVLSEPMHKIGYRVYDYFPELTKNWKLFTGEQPHKFLKNLNMKFDFLFLDSAHFSPGEIINFIEALPFLKENAIVIVHDLLWHFSKKKKLIHYSFYPSSIYLIPSIFGDKVVLGYSNSTVKNIVAIGLYNNQKAHYLDYFLLLLNFWEYMPTDKQINELKIFIKKYYKKDIYLNIFNKAFSYNKRFINNPIFHLRKKDKLI